MATDAVVEVDTTDINTQVYIEAAIKAMISNLAGEGLPAGTLMAYAGKTVPDGWLLCNGAAVSRTTYARLFKAIGTTWGAGDGSTTFNLPDCTDRFLEGTADASKVGTYLEAGLPNITGWVGDFRFKTTGSPHYSGAFSSYTKDGETCLASGNINNSSVSNRIAFYASNVSSIYKSTSTIQPPSVYALIIIKA